MAGLGVNRGICALTEYVTSSPGTTPAKKQRSSKVAIANRLNKNEFMKKSGIHESTGVAERILTELDIEPECRELIFDFFVAFSRFENLLIEDRYWKKREDGSIDVAWNEFIACCNERANHLCLDIVKRYQDFLNNQPPRKLFPSAHPPHLEWKLPTAEEDARARRLTTGPEIGDFKSLTILLRRVRNNLFHGGKFKDSSKETAARMKETLPIIQDLNRLLREVGPR